MSNPASNYPGFGAIENNADVNRFIMSTVQRRAFL
jgi:hypothetical protein